MFPFVSISISFLQILAKGMNSNFAEKFLIRNTYTWLVEIVRYYWLGLFYIVGCILHLYFNTYFVINLLYCYVYVHVANGLTGAGQVCSVWDHCHRLPHIATDVISVHLWYEISPVLNPVLSQTHTTFRYKIFFKMLLSGRRLSGEHPKVQ